MEAQIGQLLDELALQSLGLEKTKEIEDKLKKLMQLDELNLVYFLSLYFKYKKKGQTQRPLAIKDELHNDDNQEYALVYPTAMAPQELLKQLPYTSYTDLNSLYDQDKAPNAVLWIKKMQAGTGSSIHRNKYLAYHFGIDEKDVEIGAKGTDLFVKLKSGDIVSLAEIQILQAISDAEGAKFKKIILHDIISDETKDSIEAIWNKQSVVNKKLNYKQIVEDAKNLEYFGKTFQYHVPTIDSDGGISYNRQAPAGHALFGVDAMRAAYIDSLRPKIENGETLISCVGNGEDLSSAPDPLITNWMIEKKVPLVMVTTTKTEIDLKGGQISILPDPSSSQTFITMVEKAQAQMSGQLALFEKLGLRDGDGEAFFNTNMILINYNELTPIIKKLVEEIGEAAFLEVIAPSLIQNQKKQLDNDGVERTYTQLEGAMGTVILNLDKYWRSRYKKGLVHFLNVDETNRTKFFSPIKTAFDYFMQFRSDRFEFDEKSFRLVNKNCGMLPNVALKDKFYKSVQNVLDTFLGCQIIDLKSLIVEGKADFRDVTLKGNIEVKVISDEVVKVKSKWPSLEDESLTI
ncbi:MAG: UTP--glucose-1-phosphate uridylyltransferase [Bacteriovoracaceae bacterium]|nr:UTP--glucose-1-phosphate uridylyltransferase [Bacteriovoracaceae bacterium]